MRKYFGVLVFAVIALLFIFGGAIISMYTDWLWFKNLGYSVIFSKMIWTKLGIGAVMGFLFFAIVYGNLWYARRIAPPPSRMGLEQQLIERLGQFARRGIGLLIFLGSIVVSFMVALDATTRWEQWLKFSHSTPFGVADPVFHNDIGFYVFQLPFLNYLYTFLFGAIAVALIASAALHYADEAIEVFGSRLQFAPKVKSHLAVLLAGLFFLKAWGYRLDMYQLLFQAGSQFDGVGYTEAHANLPVLWILVGVAILGGLMVLANIYRRGVTLAIGAFAALIAVSILAGGIYPALVQQFSVVPNEKDKQRPYISRAIEATQEAYGLSQVVAKPFAADTTLTPEQIADNSSTIENIRLWDREHLQQAYNQIQTFQPYYHFQDVDVDRYWLTDPQTGESRYRQVWLSAREMNQNTAQTWINQHLQFTHGYGFAMSPVNEVSEEGLPDFFVYDIPPRTTVDIPITQTSTYFGELTNDYVFVKTNAPEFDYPAGDNNKTTSYSATNGVPAGGFFRKLLLALRFGDINIILNDNITSESRILFDRNVDERLTKALPFLTFDADPYLVTADGKLYWMRDAYTMTDAYPYSKHVKRGDRAFNYIRNSVKVVMDAYTGQIDAYVIQEPLKDPIIETYRKIFPGIFKDISKMPASLRDHIRYPEDLFGVQTTVYTRWHYSKTRPNEFYTNSDLWEIPNKADLTGGEAEQGGAMEPYYNIMKLPNGKTEEFILMTPYIRSGGRKNMVAWVCAKCDREDYGKIVLYQFPEGKNVYGPQQIAARASQDTVISSQLSLWNQQGSSVGTGNVIVIPIESSLLYVMPVYLVSTSTQIPELKRVIVVLGDKISMQPTLREALSEVVGAQVKTAPAMTAAKGAGAGKTAKPTAPGVPGAASSPDTKRLVDQAVTQYDAAQSAQQKGDWAEYGKQVKALKATLEELKQKSK